MRADLDGTWQRLHPLSPVVRVGRGLLGVVLVVVLQIRSAAAAASISHLIVLAVAATAGVVAWLVTRWRVADGALQVETGLLRRSSQRYPLEQIQSVDVVRPGLARMLGMAELRLRMAGNTQAAGRLAYLPTGRADTLRAELLALAHGVDQGAPAPSERLLFQVDAGSLLASVVLSGPVLTAGLVLAAAVVAALAAPSLAPAGLPELLPAGLAAATVVLRRVNGEWNTTVAEAPDGLRVRAGLVETSAETIPRGRVQALRLVQPVSWRPFGWWRLQVDVAGRATGGRQDRSASLASRALLPVATIAEVADMVDRVLPGVPAERYRPPRRARWKSPLRYANLAWAGNADHAVTTSGRLRRVTDWVPLDKVQSIRRVEGPLQRRLHLANVHLDTAGRNVRAVLRDRDAGEADELVATLPGACAEARSRAAWRTGAARGRTGEGGGPAAADPVGRDG